MRRSYFLLTLLAILLSVGFRQRASENAIPKIYVYGDFLFRSNPTAGHIDVFNLAQPASLPKIVRIPIQGNNDIAIVDGIMFADQGNDLVIFDISDITKPRRIDTISAVFRQTVAWNRTVDDGMMMEEGPGFSGCGCGSESAVSAPDRSRSGGERAGQAGSMARFAVAQGHLYCIDESNLIVFDIEQPARPQLKNMQSIGWQIETLFPVDDKLFIGGARGMFIVDAADPEKPRTLSEFQHGRACDPVFVDGDRAYVTLRGGTPCGPTEDQLLIIDITSLTSPMLVTSYPVSDPYGLAVRNELVYLCDGDGGIRVIDVHDPNSIQTLKTVSGIVPYDAILRGRLLIVTAKDKVHIFDLTDERNPVPVGGLAHDD